MEVRKINGLPLPSELLRLLDDGRWQAPADMGLLNDVFRDKPFQPSFYTLDQMRVENKNWPAETRPQYVGSHDPLDPPGDIDPRRSILIGDLGPDMPFALDFRNEGIPQVVYLFSGGDRWKTVARSFPELVVLLGLLQ